MSKEMGKLGKATDKDHKLRSTAAIVVIQHMGKSSKEEAKENAGNPSAQVSGQITNTPREAAKKAAIIKTIRNKKGASIATRQLQRAYIQIDDLRQQTDAMRVLNGKKPSDARVHGNTPAVQETQTVGINRRGAVKTAKQEFREAQREYRGELAAFRSRKKAQKEAVKELRHASRDTRTAKNATRKAKKATRKAKKAIQKARRTLRSSAAVFCGVFLIFSGLMLLVLSSAFGLFASDSDTIRSIVTELQDSYNTQIQQIQDGNPHEILHRSGRQADWREVLSVYAVDVAKEHEDGFPYSVDDKARDRLKEIFWKMNSVSYRVEEIEGEASDSTGQTESSSVSSDSTGSTEATITYLYITLAWETANSMADKLGFDTEQKEQLAELLSPDNAAMWGGLLSGITIYSTAVPNDGGWVYPLPEEAEIASPFGWRMHPIYGEQRLHEGTDFVADSGTPIFAVKAGKVTAASYTDSLGNYVAIGHDDGYTSRYLHMIFSIVHVGQEIQQGQVIGYVGSTGDSTGSHLHLSLNYAGTYIDPMGLISYVPPETGGGA